MWKAHSAFCPEGDPRGPGCSWEPPDSPNASRFCSPDSYQNLSFKQRVFEPRLRGGGALVPGRILLGPPCSEKLFSRAVACDGTHKEQLRGILARYGVVYPELQVVVWEGR